MKKGSRTSESARLICDELCQRALDLGSRDNISVSLVFLGKSKSVSSTVRAAPTEVKATLDSQSMGELAIDDEKQKALRHLTIVRRPGPGEVGALDAPANVT